MYASIIGDLQKLLFRADQLERACSGEIASRLLGRLSLSQEKLGPCEDAE